VKRKCGSVLNAQILIQITDGHVDVDILVKHALLKVKYE